jgi:hypothetical protein
VPQLDQLNESHKTSYFQYVPSFCSTPTQIVELCRYGPEIIIASSREKCGAHDHIFWRSLTRSVKCHVKKQADSGADQQALSKAVNQNEQLALPLDGFV